MADPYLEPMDWGAPQQQAQALDTRPPIDPYREQVDWNAPAAPPAGPAPAPQAQQGVRTVPPPPPVTPGVSDDEDERQFQQSLQYDLAQRKNEISYLTGEPTFKPQLVDPKTDERLLEAGRIRADIAKLPPKEQARALTQLKIQEDRILREIKDKNTAEQKRVDQQRADHLRTANYKFQDPKARQETANVINSYVDTMYQMYSEQGAPDPNNIDPKTGKPMPVDANNPEKRWQRDYTRNTSPLGTLKPVELRDAVTNIAMLNPHISNDAAMKYVLNAGSPTANLDEPGANGLKGKGGANYRLIGSDPYRGHYILQMADGQKIRVDPPTYNRLVQARVRGYQAGRAMLSKREQERAAHREAGPFERNVVRPALDWTERNVVGPVRERLQ